MNRLWAPFLLFLLLCMPLAASAQSGLPIFDPAWHLVPEASELDADCPVGAPLGFGGVLQLIQNGMNAAISFGIIICVIVITFAGILWLLTPTNPENHSQAKKVLTNAVIGLLIILSAWLIVDFVMKLLYNGETTNLGPWNQILSGGDVCVTEMEGRKPLFSRDVFAVPGQGSGTGGAAADPRYTTSGACSPQSVQQAAASGGASMTLGEAKFLACIARPESQCGADLTNYNWGKGSSAYGPFQILLDGNSRYFDNPTCARVAGVTGSLDCSAAFSGGNPIRGSELALKCMRAASNLACSSVAAHKLLKDSGHRPWTNNKDSSSAHARCIKEL